MAPVIRNIMALTALISITAGSAFAQEGPPPTPVTVVTVQPQKLTLTSLLPGRVGASAEAEVRPQVNGIITKRLFKEGSEVKEGDVLYRIDPTTYQATVAQAKASVSQAQAELASAQRDYDRAVTLRDRGVSSQQSFDDAASARDSAKAAVEVAQAQLQSAQIDLDHTQIRARLTGRIGLSDVSQGSLVTASQTTALTTIRKLDPVNVDVTQSAADLIKWRSGATPKSLEAAEADVSVTLKLADGSTYAEKGLLTAAEPHVDEETGVVTLRMQFANPEQILLPGMYVQAEMPTSTIENAYLVPMEGVTRDRRGMPQAMVVTADNKVEQRSLDVVQDRGNDWVVDKGLNPGDKIVVEGLQKIQPGATVAPTERGAAPKAGAAAGAAGAAKQD